MAPADVAVSTVTTTPTTTGAIADGPVLNIINKRLRALRKKYNRIIQMEESVSQGKILNKEQQDVLHSKTSVIHSIDELEKLRAPLATAVVEEVSLAIKNHLSEQKDLEQTSADVNSESVNGKEDFNGGVEDLVELLYFGSLFDVKQQNLFDVKEQSGLSMLLTAKQHERNCCLVYDVVTDDATDILGERDLDFIAALQDLVIRRPVLSNLSHMAALQRCIEYAKLWIERSNQPIGPEINVTYAELREKLGKIKVSEFYTLPPANMRPDDMAAVAAGGKVGSVDASYEVPLNGPVVPVVQMDGSVGQHQETENTPNHEECSESDDQNYSGAPEEPLKDELELENQAEMFNVQTDEINPQVEIEQNQRDCDSKEQQYMPRGTYQSNRGGRGARRGYANGRGGRGVGGRGGGSYQDGRSQYYNQGGNYYPRNNYYRGRGGRGGGGRGNSYYNHGSAHMDTGPGSS